MLADTVTLKYKDENSNEQSLTLNKGSIIYLDPNFGYFKKDNNKRTKKLTLNTDLDLTNNEDISTNPYIVAKVSDPKGAAVSESIYGKNTTFSSIKTMQEMTPTICEAETTPTKEAVNTTAVHSTNTNLVPEARLKDTRDNKYYTVRKLADGNCWMTDNLAYAKAGTLSPTDSDVQGGNFTIVNSDIHTEEGEKWKEEDDKKFIFDRPDPVYTSTTKTNTSFPLKGWRKTRLSNGSISLKAIYYKTNLYGNLYTWHTATAGSGANTGDAIGGGASSSICPREWILPPMRGNINYGELIRIYELQNDIEGSIKMQSTPLSLSFSGNYHYDDGHIYNIDTYGSYWGYATLRLPAPYIFSANYDNIPSPHWSAFDGLSIRCVCAAR